MPHTHPLRSFVALAGTLLTLVAAPVRADTIGLDDCSKNDCGLYGVVLHISGTIGVDDGDNAMRTLEPILDSNDRVLAMAVDTIDGDIAAAMELGRLARQLDMVVIIPEEAECLDLCLAILAGGVRRDFRGAVGFSGGTINEYLQEHQSELWFHLYKMHVNTKLVSDWRDATPGSRHIFSPANLDRYGLTSVDPVWQTEMDVRAAADLDIPFAEYQARKAAMTATGRMVDCAAITQTDLATECEHDLLVEFDLIPR